MKIRPITGREYSLFNWERAKSQSSFKGIYIGRNPVENINSDYLLFNEPEKPEGHTFARLNDKGEVEVYCTFSGGEELKLMWHSDGDDGPEWPAGFEVIKIDNSKIRKSELEYLARMLSSQNVERRVA